MIYTNESEVRELYLKQKEFFNTKVTLNVNWRKEQLKKLKSAILSNEQAILDALNKDLGRCAEEAYFCDVGSSILEINEAIRGINRWSRPENHFSGFVCFPSVNTKVYKMPYGVSLIISPFNFPILLSFGVLSAAIAAGNTAIIKVSSKSPACSEIIDKIISDTFPPEYISVVCGGHDIADCCLKQPVDKIFYTGSPKVAKHVLSEASNNITSVALELGGETGNWCIIRKDADIRDACKKIAFFKICNSGQICININQVAVAKEIAGEFISTLKEEIIRQIGESQLDNDEYAHLITKDAYEKCENEANEYTDRIIFGGKGNKDSLRFETTLIYPVNINENIVKHELFNPLLPIVEFEDDKIDELLDVISSREHGLALYIFTKDISWAKNVMSQMQYGGGCINEVCVHMMVKGVPFNGVGHSGMGAYHGKWGFNEFSHPTSVLIGKKRLNLPLRMHPFSEKNKYKIKLIRFFEK